MINKTFEELRQYREADGYIDFDKIIAENGVEIEREVRGNVNREKDWVTVLDGEVLIKTDIEEKPNSEYSELISCALARQAGIPTAEYDMVRYKGKNGLITKNVCNVGDEMISLYDLIGNGPEVDGYEDIIDIYHVFDTLDDKLQLEGFDDNEIDACMLELRKQLLFDLCIMEGDRHLENLSLIFSMEDGKRKVRLSPMYDTEGALVLYDKPEAMKNIYINIVRAAQEVDEQSPKISIIPQSKKQIEEERSQPLLGFLEQLRAGVKVSREEFGNKAEEMWKKTFDFLCEDERATEYWKTILSKLDIRQAIAEVEEKIGVKLPEHIYRMTSKCFEARQDALIYRLPPDKGEVTITSKDKNEDIAR